MSDFIRDDKWQKHMRDTILAPSFYDNQAINGRYVFIDGGRLAPTLQRRFAVDTILQGRNGAAVCIEEKIVRWPESGIAHTAFCLETHSCTVAGHESDGWMRYGQSDFLLYAFQQDDGALDVHVIDFPKLQDWFWPLAETLPTFGPLETINKSKGRLAPIRDVHAAVPCWRRLVRAPDQEQQELF